METSSECICVRSVLTTDFMLIIVLAAISAQTVNQLRSTAGLLSSCIISIDLIIIMNHLCRGDGSFEDLGLLRDSFDFTGMFRWLLVVFAV